MTKQASIELECPQCHTKQIILVWDSVNVHENPELKENLFKGEINAFRCENCEYFERLQVPLLYHDQHRGILVWYFPLSHIENDKTFLDHFNEQGVFQIKEMELLNEDLAAEFQRIHVVFDMAELVRYVWFREKLHEKWQGHATKKRRH